MKKVLKILTLVMLIFTILKIGDTYAKYFAKAHTETLSKDVGQWLIKINNQDIYSETGQIVEFNLNNFNNFAKIGAVAGDTQIGASNKIFPGSEGYIDIQIDPTGTDVAVKYDIELNLTGVSDLAITARLEMASGENTLVQTDANTYYGIINLEEVQAGTAKTVRCYLKWENDENNNEIDTAAGENVDSELNLTAKVTVTQYLGPEEPEETPEPAQEETPEETPAV